MTSIPAHGVRVSVTTLGCKVNRAESERIAAQLIASGASIETLEAADVAIVHTCCVTQEAERKVRKAVRRALAAPGAPRVVVTGCMTSIDTAALESLGERVRVVCDPESIAAAVLGAPAASPATRVGRPFRTRVMVKAQDGCDAHCAYCIVPHARGAPRSTPLDDVVAEVAALVDEGIAEVVLTGINLGLWREARTGGGADQEADLADLVLATAATGISRIRLSSIEPEHLGSRLLDAFASTPAVCPHLHVPLQSGSDAVLGAMGRGYDSETYAARIAAAREALPGLAVTTDVIAGFPGETESDHAATLALLRSLAPEMSRLHVFRYSRRPGTRAAEMPDQVPPAAISARARELRDLGESLADAHRTSRLGGRATVLVEEADADRASGTSEDYLHVEVVRPGLFAGELVEVTLDAIAGSRVVGA